MAFTFRNAFATVSLVILGAMPSVVMGQCDAPFPPSLTCSGAQVVCDLDGYCSTSGGLNAQDSPASFCGNIENNQWLAFVAGSVDLELFLFITNCSNNNGLQAQIFETSDCVNFTPVSTCFNPAFVTNGTLTATGLTVGQTYYLMIDGWAAAICDYAILVNSGSTGVAPTAMATGPIELCAGQTALLDGAGSSSGANVTYQWTTTDGTIVSGGTTLTPTINAPGTYILTVNNTLYSCADAAVVTVNPAAPPVAMAVINGSLDCANNSLMLDGNGSSTGGNISYNWMTSDGNVFSGSNTLTPTIDQGGTYILTVTDNNSGCTAEASVSVTANFAVPDANASGGTLTCTAINISLNASSNTPGVSYSWTGPGDFVSNLQNPTVNEIGNYILTVTGTNGCTANATAVVDEDVLSPDATATGGTIDCSNSSVQLFGNSTTNGVTFSWTGPNSYTSMTQNPMVTDIGIYALTITGTNGCTQTATAEVTESMEIPDAMAMGGALNCNQTSVQLNGSSTTIGVTYQWTGPNGFMSNLQNPIVSTAGDYILTVIAPNNCSNTAIATVTDNVALPDVMVMGGTIDCTNNNVQLMGNSNTMGVTYAWSGPDSYTSNLQSPTVANVGIYTLTVTNPDGCTNTATAEILSNTTTPDATATGGMIACNQSTVQLTGNSTSANIQYSWTGPGGFISNEQNPIVTEGGDYVLTVTAENGCIATATAMVNLDANAPDVVAMGGDLTCFSNEVTLMGNSITAGVTYAWSGPNGFSSTLQNPTVFVAGMYSLVVSAPNGCSATGNAIVNPPLNPDISTAGDTITCINLSAQLTGNSTTTGVMYAWTGPNGFSSNLQNPIVSIVGVYNLTVTTPNGCSAVDEAIVSEDNQSPMVSTTGGVLSCSVDSLQVFGSANVANVSYDWMGPNGFSSTISNPFVYTEGQYILTVTATNGCFNSDTILIDNDTDVPTANAVGGVINCTNSAIELMGMSDMAGVNYQWTGPNNFTANQQNPMVSEIGMYELTVILPNGCSGMATAIVTEDLDIPQFQTTTGVLTCQDSIVTIGVDFDNGTYNWTGTNGFTDATQNPTVVLAGDYSVTVTANNGCTQAAVLTVSETTNPPTATAMGGTIDCNNNTVEINGNSTTPDVTYNWTGPGGFTTTMQNPTVNETGLYELTVTAANGCTATASAMVDSAGDLPTVTATGGTQSCQNSMVQLGGSSMTADVNFIWTGPNNFNSNLQNPLVSIAGIYTLTVTSSGGCSASANALVEAPVFPVASVVGNELSCTNTSVQIFGMSDMLGSSFAWSGPNGFVSNEQNPIIAEGGNYELTITAPNGCTAESTTLITENTVAPTVTALGDTLTCTSNMVQLLGSSTAVGAVFSWTGPGGFQSAIPNPMVGETGTYTLTVTATNGCTAAADAMVTTDETIPEVTATGGEMSCDNSMIQLTGMVAMPVNDFAWTGPNGFTSDEQNPLVDFAGSYQLVVTATNGCTALATAVVEAAEIPDLVATGGTIGCNGNTILSGNSTAENPVFAWTGPNGFSSNSPTPMVTTDGTYTVLVTAANGCSNSETVNVNLDNTPPNITADAAEITCHNASVILNGNSNTQNVTYSWSSTNGFSSDLPTPSTATPGIYTLEVTAVNGCTASTTINVLNNTTPPDVMAVGGALTCFAEVIQLTGSSTTPNVSYAWTDSGAFAATQSNPIVSEAGDYTLTVTAENGCTATAVATVVSNTVLPIVEAGLNQHIDCDNREVTLSGTFDTPSGNGTKQWFTFDGSISGNPESNNTQVDRAGTYFFEVVDAENGCFSIDSVVVTQEENMILDVLLSSTPTCPGATNGSIVLDDVIGGVSPFLMSVAGSAFEQTTVFGDLNNGQFLVVIEDAMGCQFDTYITVEETDGVEVDLGADVFLQYGDSLLITTQITVSQDSLVDISWSMSNFLNCTDCLRPMVTPQMTETYQVIVTDVNGCTAMDEIVVAVSERYPVYLPNVFSPNGDGENDVFTVFGGEQVEEVQLMRVFDRWGALMFEQTNFPANDENMGWDGTFNGNLMNSGVYIYFVEVLFKEGTTQIFKGDVLIMR